MDKMKSRFPSLSCFLGVSLIIMSLAACQQKALPSLPPSAIPIISSAMPLQTVIPTEVRTPTLPLKPTPLSTPMVTLKPSKTLVVHNSLDQSGKWEAYVEGSPEWTISNTSTPSLDGNALQCSLTGGAPYSNLHCYQNLPSEPTADIFTLTLSFWFAPTTTCNNRETDSIVQALEFTMNKWYASKRYEFALQWQNVGDGAPQWRYWNPHGTEKWAAPNPAVSECLAGQQWHTITLIGSIRDDQVYYESFVVDNQSHEMGFFVPPASAPGEADRLAVAVQLDGNASQTSYDVHIDKMIFTAQSTQP